MTLEACNPSLFFCFAGLFRVSVVFFSLGRADLTRSSLKNAPPPHLLTPAPPPPSKKAAGDVSRACPDYDIPVNVQSTGARGRGSEGVRERGRE